MPIGQFLPDFGPDVPRFQLTKTTRPYFIHSRTLFLACRRLPEPPADAAIQIKDLQKLMDEVEHAIFFATHTSRDGQIECTDEAFQAADESLHVYIAKYNVTMMLAPDTDELKEQVIQPRQDQAGSRIKQSKVLKLKSMKQTANITLNIFLWPEIPRKWAHNHWQYESYNLDVEIEESANLNILLHQLLWAMATDHFLPSFSLKQNPQFYAKFPNRKKDFFLTSLVSESSSDLYPHIPALCMWEPVQKYQHSLHLIVDQDTSDGVLLSNLSKLHLPEVYSNGWHLDDDENLIVVREKGGSHKLLLWDTTKLQMAPISDNVTAISAEVSA